MSDRLVTDDVLTSIHINEYDATVMDTKLGPEELTRDIPNVGELDLRNLAEDGIIVPGSDVGKIVGIHSSRMVGSSTFLLLNILINVSD